MSQYINNNLPPSSCLVARSPPSCIQNIQTKPKPIPPIQKQQNAQSSNNYYQCLDDDSTNPVLDSGTNGHLFPTGKTSTLVDVRPTTHPITVMVANKNQLTSTHEAMLPIPELPTNAKHVDILPGLASPLISISKLAEAGCITTFDNDKAIISLKGSEILRGQRNPYSGLYHLRLSTKIPHKQQKTYLCPLVRGDTTTVSVSNWVLTQETVKDRIAFLHACAGYPAVSTWCAAINAGHYNTWAGLTSKLVRKHIKSSVPMTLGHLDNQRINLQSTKTPDQPLDNIQIPTSKQEESCNAVFVSCEPATGQVFSDQTGKFLVPSTAGHNYIMVLYDYDSNNILTEPMKSRTAQEHKRVYQIMHSNLVNHGL